MAERSTNFNKSFFSDFIKTLTQEDFITYPSHKEYDSLRNKIAKKNNLSTKNVFLAAGSGACIESLIHITSNSKTNIVSSFPCFPMYFVYADCYNSNFKKVDYGDDDASSIKKIINNIDDNTTLVILANPNSPYGDYKTKKEIKKLCDYTKKMKIILLIDEAYIDFAPSSCLGLIKEYDNLIISRTFSKAWGAAGIRIGYMLGNEKIIETISNVQQAYPISGPSVKFANFLLDNEYVVKEYAEKTVKERNKFCNLLKETGRYDVINSNTNFVHIHEKYDNNEKIKNILDKHNIACKFGATIPGDHRKTWIRISIGPNSTNLPFFKDML